MNLVSDIRKIGRRLIAMAKDGSSHVVADERVFEKVAESEERLDTAETDIAAAKGRLDIAEDSVTSIEDRIDTAESNITAADGRIDTAESSIIASEGRLDTAEIAITTAEGRLDTAEERLDDLEEGALELTEDSWAVQSLNGPGGLAAGSLTLEFAHYTRINNWVHCSLHISNINAGAFSNPYALSLPFEAADLPGARWAGSIGFSGDKNVSNLGAIVRGNENALIFQYLDGTSEDPLDHNAIGTIFNLGLRSLVISISYIAKPI